MVQQSATRSPVSATAAMPRSTRKQNSIRSEGRTYSQRSYEQQSQHQDQTHLKHTDQVSLPQPPIAHPRSRQEFQTEFVKLPPRSASHRARGGLHQPYSDLVNQPTTADEFNSISTTLPQSPQQRRLGQRQRRKPSFMLYAIRLLILGVGISAIAGTILSILDPTKRIVAEDMPAVATESPQVAETVNQVLPAAALKLDQEILPLKTVVQQLAAKNANLMPGIFVVDLDNGAYLDLNGEASFAAASTIKFPILIAFFQDVDAGKIRLDEKLSLKKEQIGGGSGDIQYKTPGTQFTALEVATKMMRISDNTATNMLIDRLGGIEALNQRFQTWGLQSTQLRNPLPDLPGTNTTSPRELGQLMAMVNQQEIITVKSRDRLLDIMQRTTTTTLLPKGLGAGATIAHKTGDIGSMVGDVGLIDLPSGKRYIAVVMVKRPHNDNRAQELIRQVSRAAYQQFSQPTVSDVMPSTPFVTTTPVGR